MQGVNFHESTVTGFTFEGSEVVLVLEDVNCNDAKADARLVVENVSMVKIDKISSDVITMKAPDGEVLDLDVSDGKLFVLIEWNDFEESSSFTNSYDISGEKVTLAIK
ncbi:hypothetical protein [Vibrio sp. Hep-1b-8]|uniref:hypothetical protein n=1 Tax=Vibrio sp. Hep-1b-8 TaxID=2144187 RepID=UPI001110023F|nr:hypothetical protein [Vibrio sp. Hep-1b-8]TMX35213.1 hypothetical protein DA100_14380 [Vibrio sp. Hep-1b-8]